MRRCRCQRVTCPIVTEPEFLRATRAGYDAVAESYAAHFRDELAARPLERALLAWFAELVQATAAGPVADIGCGTGRVTAHLHELGAPVFGIDLSEGMLAVARRSNPGIQFQAGSMLALDLPDGALGGILAWYSVVHIPRERLPEVFAGFCRVLAPGGLLLLAFQAGDGTRHLTEALGQQVTLDFHRLPPRQAEDLLDRAGLPVHARMVREPEPDGPFPERTPQAFLLARKPLRAATG